MSAQQKQGGPPGMKGGPPGMKGGPPGMQGGPPGMQGGPPGMDVEQMKRKMKESFYEYRGITYNEVLMPRANMEAMDTFEVRDDDIFITTYAKCGTHWTMEIVYLILADGHPDKIDRSEKMKFGALEMSLPSNKLPSYKMVQEIKSRRVLPTHLSENVLPPQALKNKGKIVYVTRNPKDCLVSLYRFAAGTFFDMGPFDVLFDKFLSPNMLGGNFFDFNLNYWKHRHDDNFLFLKYEDMKRDTRSAVINIADHIGCALSQEAIDRVVENCSVAQMKKTYAKVDDQNVLPKVGPLKSLTNFIRKGVVGDWKNHFTVAQNEKFDELYREKFAGSGLKFEFE